MARADLLKKSFEGYQSRDDRGFRAVAAAIVEDERRKQHPVLANELQNSLPWAVDATGGRSAASAWAAAGTRHQHPQFARGTPDRYLPRRPPVGDTGNHNSGRNR